MTQEQWETAMGMRGYAGSPAHIEDLKHRRLNPVSAEIERLAFEMAIDGAWALIESYSLAELDGQNEWMNATDEHDSAALGDAFKLLLGLHLAEVHPDHPAWIREIAEW